MRLVAPVTREGQTLNGTQISKPESCSVFLKVGKSSSISSRRRQQRRNSWPLLFGGPDHEAVVSGCFASSNAFVGKKF